MPKVLVPLAEGFEEMEGIIIIDVLRRGGVEVVSASLQEGPVKASRNTVHIADAVLSDVQNSDFDMIVLPGGGPGAENLKKDAVLKEILLRMHGEKKAVAAICAAPNVLRTHGIIQGDDLYTQFPTTVSGASGGKYTEERLVTAGNITTSVGPGSAFEFALYLLEKLKGKKIRDEVEAGLKLP